jgi:hypothetical protein
MALTARLDRPFALYSRFPSGHVSRLPKHLEAAVIQRRRLAPSGSRYTFAIPYHTMGYISSSSAKAPPRVQLGGGLQARLPHRHRRVIVAPAKGALGDVNV